MKKKMLVLRSVLIVFVLSISLLGCGNENTEVADAPEVETETESVWEEPEVEEETTTEEEPTEDVKTEETTEADTQEPTSMVDWETFAAQADNDDICIVVSNETTGNQEVLEIDEGQDHCEYTIQEGDKISIPVKSNIIRITYWTATSDPTEIYNNAESSGTTSKFIEFDVEQGEIYQINITDTDGKNSIFVLFS